MLVFIKSVSHTQVCEDDWNVLLEIDLDSPSTFNNNIFVVIILDKSWESLGRQQIHMQREIWWIDWQLDQEREREEKEKCITSNDDDKNNNFLLLTNEQQQQ